MRLRWLAAALDDLDRIAMFNERRSPELAGRVQNAIIARAEALTAAPFRGRRIDGTEDRAVLIGDIQYVLHYAVAGDEVIIKAVHHTRELR